MSMQLSLTPGSIWRTCPASQPSRLTVAACCAMSACQGQLPTHAAAAPLAVDFRNLRRPLLTSLGDWFLKKLRLLMVDSPFPPRLPGLLLVGIFTVGSQQPLRSIVVGRGEAFGRLSIKHGLGCEPLHLGTHQIPADHDKHVAVFTQILTAG